MTAASVSMEVEAAGVAGVNADANEQMEQVLTLFSTKIADMLTAHAQEQKKRHQLLLQRMSCLDDIVSELRTRVCALSRELLLTGDAGSSKNPRKKNKKTRGDAVSCNLNQASGALAADYRTTHTQSHGTTDTTEAVMDNSTAYCAQTEHTNSCVQICTDDSDVDSTTDLHVYRTNHDANAVRRRGRSRSRPRTMTSDCDQSASTNRAISGVSSDRSTRSRSRSRARKTFPPLDDDSWQLVTSKRPEKFAGVQKRALYLGNLRSGQTDEDIRNFITHRATTVGVDVTLVKCSLLELSGDEFRSAAHIVVDKDSEKVLRNRSFWPKPVYCRPWKFKETPAETGQPSPPSSATTASMVAECRRVSSQESKNVNVDQSSQNSDSTADDLRLELSPESNWGDDDLTAMVTPRGKTRGHETQSPPDQIVVCKRQTGADVTSTGSSSSQDSEKTTPSQ